MDWNQLLTCLRPEVLTEVLQEFGIGQTSDNKLRISAIVTFLKRETAEEEKALIDFLRNKVLVYELTLIMDKLGLDKPADRTQYFDYIIGHLKFIEREDEEDVDLKKEDVTEVTLHEIVTEDEAGPEYTEEDEREWGMQAAVFVNAFRKINYSLGEAVADVIDNSIDVGATEVSVNYEMDRENGCRYLIIADNGPGMDDARLQESMTLGLRRKRLDTELGKFGVGLKWSSLSQADEIIVISQDKNAVNLALRRISYPHIKRTDTLKLLTKTGRDILHYNDAMESLGSWKTGTAVLWEKMDESPIPFRLKHHRDMFEKQKMELRDFLSVVFHRYITGDTKSGRKIEINLQNNPIQPIDPLGLDLTQDEQGYGTICSEKIEEYETSDGVKHPIKITMAIHPHRERMEAEYFQRMRNAVGSPTKAQGVYLYRNNRLVKFGGWMGIGERIPHPSSNLCRVSLDIPISLDDEFKLEPTKTDYSIPELFKEDLHNLFTSKSRDFANGSVAFSFLDRGKHRARFESKVRKHADDPLKRSKTKPVKTVSTDGAEKEPGLLKAPILKPKSKTTSKSSQRKKVSVVIVNTPFNTELLWVQTKASGTTIFLNKGHQLYDKAIEALLREIE